MPDPARFREEIGRIHPVGRTGDPVSGLPSGATNTMRGEAYLVASLRRLAWSQTTPRLSPLQVRSTRSRPGGRESPVLPTCPKPAPAIHH